LNNQTSVSHECLELSGIERKILQAMYYLRHFFFFCWLYALRVIVGKNFAKVLYDKKLFKFFYLVRLCYVRRIERTTFAQTRINGFSLVQPLDNVFINDEIFYGKYYERYRAVLKNDVVVDVGAHVGVFSIKSATVALKVIAIEPSPCNFKLLKFNTESNHFKNIALVNSAAADYDGDAKLYLPNNSGMNSILSELASASVETVNVKVKKLDSLLKELNIGKIDFLKIDVEGAEYYVLKGAFNTLKKYKPYIAMEYHAFLSGQAKNKIRSFLEKLNYSCEEAGNYIYAYQSRKANQET